MKVRGTNVNGTLFGARVRLQDGTTGTIFGMTSRETYTVGQGRKGLSTIHISQITECGDDIDDRPGVKKLCKEFGIKLVTMRSLASTVHELIAKGESHV